MCDNQYQTNIILIFFSSGGEDCTLGELADILGLPEEKLELVLNRLINSSVLDIDELGKITISEAGKQHLGEHGLLEVDIDMLMADPTDSLSLITGDRLGVGEIYIPSDFCSKFQGYTRIEGSLDPGCESQPKGRE